TTSLPASTTTSMQATSTTMPSGPPVGWLAPNGVPLAVTSFDDGSVETLGSCGDPITLETGTPIYEVDVLLDPGHGGPVDTGAMGFNGLAEKEINLRVGLATAEFLAAREIEVMLTRVGDYPMPIPVRTEYAELVEAEVVVSIHHNAPEAPASDIPGVEIFVQQASSDSQRLGGLIYDETMEALDGFDIDWDRAPDAGVMTVVNSSGEDAYGMVRRPSMPSVLVELGYIANDAEAHLYRQPEYVPTAAIALANAIEQYLTGDDTGAGLVPGRDFDPNPGVGADRCIDVDLEQPLYPDVTAATLRETEGLYEFIVTISSPQDSEERHADAFRVIGDDGIVYAVEELEWTGGEPQPFTATVTGLAIPESVNRVTIEGRDLVYGWGGGTVEVPLP
ncbi:MAG TPA: N-acetylmuramoyl-L-alanine amidase, partial [Acidimicrobiia bacterium]